MGLLESLEGLAGGPDPQTRQKVAGGLMQALDEHPGGLAGLLTHLRNNGMDQHVNSWAGGQPQPASPDQIQQGLGNTGLIDKVAERAGVSPQTAKVVLATILPMVVAHLTRGGQQPAPQSGLGGMASEILSKL